jgi:hypothetical protein
MDWRSSRGEVVANELRVLKCCQSHMPVSNRKRWWGYSLGNLVRLEFKFKESKFCPWRSERGSNGSL